MLKEEGFLYQEVLVMENVSKIIYTAIFFIGLISSLYSQSFLEHVSPYLSCNVGVRHVPLAFIDDAKSTNTNGYLEYSGGTSFNYGVSGGIDYKTVLAEIAVDYFRGYSILKNTGDFPFLNRTTFTYKIPNNGLNISFSLGKKVNLNQKTSLNLKVYYGYCFSQGEVDYQNVSMYYSDFYDKDINFVYSYRRDNWKGFSMGAKLEMITETKLGNFGSYLSFNKMPEFLMHVDFISENHQSFFNTEQSFRFRNAAFNIGLVYWFDGKKN